MMVSNVHVWRAAQERLRQEISRAQFDTWLRGTQLCAQADGQTVLYVRTTFARELLETRYRERIEAAIAEVTGRSCSLSIRVGHPDAQAADTVAAHRSSAGDSRPNLRDGYVVASLFGQASDGTTAQRPEMLSAPVLAGAVVGTPRSVTAAPVTPLAAAVRMDTRSRLGRMRQAMARTQSELVAAHDETVTAMGPQIGPTVAPRTPTGQHSSDDGPPSWESGRQKQTVHVRDGDSAVSDNDAALEGRSAPGAASSDVGDGDNERDVEGDAERSRLWQGERAWREGPDRLAGGDEHPDAAFALPLTPPRLNARYTFSTFIVGSSNQLAHAASQAVAEAPGQAYNPLFLYGGVGLGKTHLLHAIGHTALERSLTVLYVSSETFTNEIVNAIRYRTTEEFRAKYRSVDLLLVDDIQFIVGKESTEEEFFHTFNSLYETNRQIVICSDRPPKAIVSLAERLRSRFEWGLIADVQPPDLETRVAILRAKADSMHRHVPDDVISYVASRVQSNIRELEGSFNRLLAFAELQGLPLTTETAKAALANLATDGKQRRLSIADVLDAVASHFRMSPADLRGKQRDKYIVVPRHIAMYLMRQETEASLLEIGQALGGRDHSTVLHACEKIGRDVIENTEIRKDVHAIRQYLGGQAGMR